MIRSGITRIAWLIGPYAIKVPNVRYGWGNFLRGLLSNMQEARFSPMSDTFHLAPVLFSLRGGWLNVQRRCAPLSDEQWVLLEGEGGRWKDFECDFKRDNFGFLKGRVVLLDYGEMT